ncbi:hypothetical protein HF847_11610 [Clostridium cochlearium]|uniref:Phage protein n=1 Tax=Clostridium cochlearium TaxID=1494 RepID=A0ABY0QLE3_CLOCO|nr:hypothetical protein [Clostridium cochlearium]NME96617.1 hypothetical protein [Clostridium cochlearium]SDL15202.1 hypothetical protein SAMN05216497_10943 [Clostridium cochlearium]
MNNEQLKKEILDYLKSDEFDHIKNTNDSLGVLIKTIIDKFQISKYKLNKMRNEDEKFDFELKNQVAWSVMEKLLSTMPE